MSKFIKRNMENFDPDRNCFFRNGKAYTKDGVLVYNICLYRIPKKYTQEQVNSFFAQFGKVEVYFVHDDRIPKYGSANVGFANYIDPIDAAFVLYRSYYAIEKKQRIWIKAAYSWLQPQKARINSKYGFDLNYRHYYSNNNSYKIHVEKYDNILLLNDDCLEMICKKLDVRSQIHFSHVCRRFRSVFQMSCKSQYRFVDMTKLHGLTLWEKRHFFECTGDDIEQITNLLQYPSNGRTLEYITQFCPNAKSISLVLIMGKHQNYFPQFCKNMKSLNKLELINCKLQDRHCMAFENLPNLQHLVLDWNFEITGRTLKNLHNLKSLSLYICFKLHIANLLKPANSWTKLRTLGIQSLLITQPGWGIIFYNKLIEKCKNLEYLRTACYSAEAMERITHLPSLRRLELTTWPELLRRFLTQLTERKADQMDYLNLSRNGLTYENAIQLTNFTELKQLICSHNSELDDFCLRQFSKLENLEKLVIVQCPAITNSGLLRLLDKCKKLRILDVSCCMHISSEFVFEAIKLLKKRKQRSEGQQPQLTCWVQVTKITEDILKDSQYIAAKAYIKLIIANDPYADYYNDISNYDN